MNLDLICEAVTRTAIGEPTPREGARVTCEMPAREVRD